MIRRGLKKTFRNPRIAAAKKAAQKPVTTIPSTR